MQKLNSFLYSIFTLCMTPANTTASDDIDRLLYGEIMYESLQERHLNALLKHHSLASQHPDNNSRSRYNTLYTKHLLDFGLSKHVHDSLIPDLIDSGNIKQNNQRILQLARFYHSKQMPVATIHTLNMIHGDPDKTDRYDIAELKALSYMRTGKYDSAVKLLEELYNTGNSTEFVEYNRGIAHLLTGNEYLGLSSLSSLGQLDTDDPLLLALKDRTNLILGYHFLESGDAERAKKHFSRVRMESPYTDQALLGSGWAWLSLGKTERAIVPWSLLHENQFISDAVIESKMALPYAYAKLNAHGKASNLYAHAIETLESQLSRLELSINNIRNGELTQVLLNSFDTQGDQWFIDLLTRIDSRQEHYLTPLFQSAKFREQAEYLHDLALIQKEIDQWTLKIAAYTRLATTIQKHYNATLPDIDKEIMTIYTLMNNITSELAQPSPINNSRQATGSEIAQLKQNYTNTLNTQKAVYEYYTQLPEFSQQLSAFSNQLSKFNNELGSAISNTARQIVITSIDILDNKHKQLKGYRSNALFALAESYDFATRKKQ